MTNQEILDQIAKLEKAINSPSTPESVRPTLVKKVEKLKSELASTQEKVEKKEEKIEQEEKKLHSDVEEQITKLEKAINSPSTPDSVKPTLKKKLEKIKSELAEQKKEIKEEKKEAVQEKKEVKKAVEKLEKIAKRKTPIKKKEKAAKAEVVTKKVKIKEKEREVKSKTRKRKLKTILTDLEKLVKKNKSLKREYLSPKNINPRTGKSKTDLKRDSGRSAKPIGYRFVGEHDYRRPSPEQVEKGLKRGTVYKESRPNRGDVFPKGYNGAVKGLKKKKLAEGGMADGGMQMKKGGDPRGEFGTYVITIFDGGVLKHEEIVRAGYSNLVKEMAMQEAKKYSNPKVKVQKLSKKEYEEGGKMKRGGMSPQKKAANHGASWTLDHYKHNKKESYEVPMKKRKIRKRY